MIDSSLLSPAAYGVIIVRGLKCRARDGVMLSVDLYRPALDGNPAPGKFPAIIALLFPPLGHEALNLVIGQGRGKTVGRLFETIGQLLHQLFKNIHIVGNFRFRQRPPQIKTEAA